MIHQDQPHDTSPAARARSATGFRASLALIVCGSIMFGILMSTLARPAQSRPVLQWYQIVMGVVVAASIIPGLVMLIIYSSRRRKQLAAAMSQEYARLGFTSIGVPAKGSRDALFRNFAHLPFLKHGSKGISSAASGVLDQTPIELIVHTYIVSTGKSAHTVHHTVASCGCPPGWPTMTMTPEHALHKIAGMLGYTDIRVESEAFNRAWHVKSDDEAFAVTLLSPALQAWMESNSRNESWHIGHGRVCRVRRAVLVPEAIEPFLGGLLELVRLIPPEMQAWESKPPTA